MSFVFCSHGNCCLCICFTNKRKKELTALLSFLMKTGVPILKVEKGCLIKEIGKDGLHPYTFWSYLGDNVPSYSVFLVSSRIFFSSVILLFNFLFYSFLRFLFFYLQETRSSYLKKRKSFPDFFAFVTSLDYCLFLNSETSYQSNYVVITCTFSPLTLSSSLNDFHSAFPTNCPMRSYSDQLITNLQVYQLSLCLEEVSTPPVLVRHYFSLVYMSPFLFIPLMQAFF